jgi:hypothetical protein
MRRLPELSENPASFSAMRCANVVRSQHFPFRIVPACVQAFEDNIESVPNKSGGVFHKDESRSSLPNDAEHLEPEGRFFSGDTGAVSGGTNVLARKTSRYHVNNASP